MCGGTPNTLKYEHVIYATDDDDKVGVDENEQNVLVVKLCL